MRMHVIQSKSTGKFLPAEKGEWTDDVTKAWFFSGGTKSLEAAALRPDERIVPVKVECTIVGLIDSDYKRALALVNLNQLNQSPPE